MARRKNENTQLTIFDALGETAPTTAKVIQMRPKKSKIAEMVTDKCYPQMIDAGIQPTKTCPKCGRSGTIDQMFGWRVMGGKKRPQSQCKKCRGGSKKPMPAKEITERQLHDQLCPKDKGKSAKQIRQEAAEELRAYTLSAVGIKCASREDRKKASQQAALDQTQRIRIEFWDYDLDDDYESTWTLIKTEYFDKKLSQKDIKAAIKKLDCYCAHLYDKSIPEVMWYHTDSCETMLCPSESPGSGLGGPKYFHLYNKLSKSEMNHLIVGHEIDLGHALNKKLKLKIHDDGLSKTMHCIACATKFNRTEAQFSQAGYSNGVYGKVCCSAACYADAHARKIDWVKAALTQCKK